ncbi:MAG: glutamyl-tRNA reductase [Rhodospirillaceae bacterium]
MPYFVTGSHHRLWTAAVRDRLFTEPAEVPALLERLQATGLSQAVWLATCDRTEIIGAAADRSGGAAAARSLLAERAGLPAGAGAGALFTLTGAEAVRHVFAVTASLESQVVGEPQVPGQVKAAYRGSVAAGATGPALDALMQAAFAVAKRVRAETTISERPTSIAAAAVEIARDLHGDLSRRQGLLIGLGDMGLLMVEGLRAAGLGALTVMTPVASRAEAAARRLGCHHAPFAGLENALAGADIVVTAVGLGRYILTAGLVEAAVRRRRRQPVFVIDTALPSDVEPGAGEIDAAFVYDLTDLERVAMQGRVSREAAAAAAWEIVGGAVADFLRQRAERAAVPAVMALRGHFEAARREVLAGGACDAAEATRRLVNRLLHRPSEALRRLAAGAERAEGERLLRLVFQLEDEAGGPETEPPNEDRGP